MENGLDIHLFRWRVLRIFSVAWLLLTLGSTLAFLPSSFLSAGILGMVFGGIIGALAVAVGGRRLAVAAILDAGLMFFMLLLSQTAQRTLSDNLPVTMLQFLMFLFTIEILSLVFEHNALFSAVTVRSDPSSSIPILGKSIQQVFRRISRLGLLFASCYFISLGLLYVGSFFSLIVPVLSDISLYIVVVTISLSLLIVLQEDQDEQF